MENITNNHEITRSVQAGGYYCKVCGYTNNSRLNVMGHVAANHPLDWIFNWLNLVAAVSVLNPM